MAKRARMSLKSVDYQVSKRIDLVFVLAIAGRIDAQGRILAQQLDEGRQIYYGYAVLDSLSSSYSMFKYFFDIFVPNSDSDSMHEAMMTPGGIIAITAESLFLVSFSALAVKFDNEKEESYKKFIATAWPYFRDVIKGLKNAYKGWRSAVVAASLIGGIDLKYLIAPIGLILGVLAAANRFWLRHMVEERKTMMTNNAKLRNEIKNLLTLTPEESNFFFHQIKKQSEVTRILAFLSVAAGGFLDGLYLYVGVLGLAVLSPAMLSSMAYICVFYTLACMITRVYEEYDFQVRLCITQTKCKLEINAKVMETTYIKFLALQEKPNKTITELNELKILKEDIYSLLDEFEVHRKVLSQQSTQTYFTAILLGIKNGLYAYGALASILFLSASLLSFYGVLFPPALIVISVTLGLLFMATFLVHSLVMNYQHLNKEKTSVERPYDQLIDMKNKIHKNQEIDELPEEDSFRQSVNDGLKVDSSPQFFFQEWFEVLRSIFSGLGKGQKFVDFAANPLQEPDEHGHYHDSKIMYVLSLFSALLFGATLGLRALTRGFGRVPLGQQQEQPAKTADSGQILLQTKPPATSTTEIELQPKVSENPIQSIKPRTDSLSRSYSHLPVLGLFETKSGTTKKFHRSESDASLMAHSTIPDDTILGLA